MPDHNGPCRFGQYNKFQRVLFDRLGFNKAEIISPSNDNSYEDISAGHGTKFRYNSWRGFVAVDLLRKFKQEHSPYELIPGNTDIVYKRGLDQLVKCMENDGKGLAGALENIGKSFMQIPLSNGKRKPVISVMGEVFMRDNPYCSAFMVDRLEKFGAETLISGFSQFLVYFTIRYLRDSRWKGDYKGILKSKIQEFTQTMTANRITKAVYEMYDNKLDVSVNEMLDSSAPYIHRHYDGDAAVNLGTSVALAKRGVSGLANIIPFTCMPGAIVEAVSHKFRADYNHIPAVHIAFDGQEDSSIEMRLQAFMHQAYQYRDQHGLTGFGDAMKNHMKNQKEMAVD